MNYKIGNEKIVRVLDGLPLTVLVPELDALTVPVCTALGVVRELADVTAVAVPVFELLALFDSDGELDWMSSSQSDTAWRTLLNGGEVYGTDMGAYWISRNDLMDISTTISCGNCQTEKAILIRDLNGDTFPDVYVGLPGAQNQLWHNTDGKGKMNHVSQAYLPSVSDPSNWYPLHEAG